MLQKACEGEFSFEAFHGALPRSWAYHKEESHLNIFCKTEQLQSYSLNTGFRMTPPGLTLAHKVIDSYKLIFMIPLWFALYLKSTTTTHVWRHSEPRLIKRHIQGKGDPRESQLSEESSIICDLSIECTLVGIQFQHHWQRLYSYYYRYIA